MNETTGLPRDYLPADAPGQPRAVTPNRAIEVVCTEFAKLGVKIRV